eukprot:COSAG01_NODE_16583_length_1223_cov_3.446619_3_plen_44_part_01
MIFPIEIPAYGDLPRDVNLEMDVCRDSDDVRSTDVWRVALMGPS